MLGDDAFVSEAPVERKVVLGKAGTQTVWFREMSDADWQRYSAMRSSDDIEVRLKARAFIISKSVCGPDGVLLDLEKAAKLKLRFGKALEEEVLKIEAENRADAGNELEPGEAEPGAGTT